MPETIAPTEPNPSVADRAAERAAAIDAGSDDPRRTLAELAAEGLLSLGLPGGNGTIGEQATVIEQLAEGCLATAFCAWGHRMSLEYLATASGDHFEPLARFDRIGSSAMAGAYKAISGLEKLSVNARRDGDGFIFNGRMPWASNLHDDTTVVLAVEVEDEGPMIFAVPLGIDGVSVRPMRDLLALEATASGQILFEDARVNAAALHPEPFADLLKRAQRPFLILQTAYCVGLTRTALDAAGKHLDGLGAEFAGDAEELRLELDRVAALLSELADDDAAATRELVQLRLDAAVMARESVRVEAAVTGGRGFVASSPTGRRVREAAFLPVQSPTEGQLRWQLRQSA